MKQLLRKFLPLMGVVLIAASCSSDDSGSADINYPVEENVMGKWYMASKRVNNGEDVLHVHACASSRDYKEFQEDMWVNTVTHNADCVPDSDMADWSAEDDIITTNFFDPIVGNLREYRVIKLTDEELILKVTYENSENQVTEVTRYTRD